MSKTLVGNIIDSFDVLHRRMPHLCDINPRYDNRGRYKLHGGHSGIIYEVDWHNHHYALKCFTKESHRRAEVVNFLRLHHNNRIITPRYFPAELPVVDTQGRVRELDVMLYDWVDGYSLDFRVSKCIYDHDTAEMERLAEEFVRLALDMLRSQWRHGDLKPANIIVGPDSKMLLIDTEALWAESLPPSNEAGSVGYTHPTRGNHYDSHLDDYPITLITIGLYALVIGGLKPIGSEADPLQFNLYNPSTANNLRTLFEGNAPLLDLLEGVCNNPNNHKYNHLITALENVQRADYSHT